MPADYRVPGSGSRSRAMSQNFTATGAGDPIALSGQVAVQITGSATAATVQMQRSTRDPGGTANWAPVGDPITGNPSTGMSVQGFYEPSSAWWRPNVTAITGSSFDVDVSGGRG